jgi:hypothetical protein
MLLYEADVGFDGYRSGAGVVGLWSGCIGFGGGGEEVLSWLLTVLKVELDSSDWIQTSTGLVL